MSDTPLQAHIRENGIDSLKELGINVYFHPSLPLVGFKYNQIDSPKTHEVVRWARGTVLEKDTWKIVAQPFKRFFNYGENLSESFDWTDFHALTKDDGSLTIAYYYAGEWHVNTSGSFGLANYDSLVDETWRGLFWRTFEAVGGKKGNLDASLTYIFELCTPENRVVRTYAKPSLFLLGVFRGVAELSQVEVAAESEVIGVHASQSFSFVNIQEIEDFLNENAKKDASFEGVVVRDKNNVRFKIKSASYLALHHMLDNGGLFRVKRMIELALVNEGDEVLAYFPSMKDEYEAVRVKLEAKLAELQDLWEKNKGIESQKDFALAIKGSKYSSLLFQARKTGKSVPDLWRQSSDLIIKNWD